MERAMIELSDNLVLEINYSRIHAFGKTPKKAFKRLDKFLASEDAKVGAVKVVRDEFTGQFVAEAFYFPGPNADAE